MTASLHPTRRADPKLHHQQWMLTRNKPGDVRIDNETGLSVNGGLNAALGDAMGEIKGYNAPEVQEVYSRAQARPR